MRRFAKNYYLQSSEKKWNEFNLFLQDSEELLDATLDKEEQTAAEKIEKIHSEYISSIQYNNEN